MDKRPIEQQVAELTPEQRSKMGEIYKKYLISVISAVAIGVIIMVSVFLYAVINEEKAKDRYESLGYSIFADEDQPNYNLDLYDEHSDALDDYYDMKSLKPLSLVFGGVSALIGLGVVYLVFKKKYPYFNEKRYTYLKKTQNS